MVPSLFYPLKFYCAWLPAGSSLTIVIVLCPWARHINPSLVPVQPRKTRPYTTERLFMGHKESNQTIRSTVIITHCPKSMFGLYPTHFVKISWNIGVEWVCIMTLETWSEGLYQVEWVHHECLMWVMWVFLVHPLDEVWPIGSSY